MEKKKLSKGLYWRGNRIWGTVRINGHKLCKPMVPVGQSLATTRPGVAAELYRTWLRDLGRVEESPDISGILNDFQAWRKALGFDSARNRANILHFAESQGVTKPEQITESAISRWVISLSIAGHSPKTVRNKVAAVTLLCRYLVKMGHMDRVPAVDRPRVPEKLPRFLNESEYARALELARLNGCYLEVLIALKTGMRLGEIRTLHWEYFHWDQKIIVLPKTKSDHPRTIPINSELVKELGPVRQSSGPVFPGRDYGNNSGYRDLHTFLDHLRPLQKEMKVFTAGQGTRSTGRLFHLFRHTFGVRLAMAGVPITDIKEIMGHADIRTTMIYSRYTITKYNPGIEFA